MHAALTGPWLDNALSAFSAQKNESALLQGALVGLARDLTRFERDGLKNCRSFRASAFA